MIRLDISPIHKLVQRADGRVEIEETTPRFVEEPWELEDEDEPEVEGGPSFTPGTADRTAVIRI